MGALGPVAGDERFGFGDEFIVRVVLVGNRVDAAAFRLRPAVGPVGSVEAAVGAELHIGRERAGEKRFRVGDLVGGAFGFQVVSVDAAASDRAFEVGDEERSFVGIVQAGAGVILDAGRAVF